VTARPVKDKNPYWTLIKWAGIGNAYFWPTWYGVAAAEGSDDWVAKVAGVSVASIAAIYFHTDLA
jgi:hypothetical protein